MAATEDSDIPESGAVFTFGKSHFAENLPNKFWVKNDKVLQVACGDEHTSLITDSGRIFVFGSNSWGQLGLQSDKVSNKPSCIKCLKSEKLKLVSCGRCHTVVATESGKLFAFGSNAEGQIGVDGTQDSHVPVHIDTLDATSYCMLQSGADHSVALTEDGRVFVWGGGGEGQLGLDHLTDIPTPHELPFEENIVCIACGYYHTAVLTESGELFTFGETEGGKLGLGNNPSEYSTPQRVSSIPEKVKWVSCGGSHTAILTESGKVYTFGEGSNGQLGQGTQMLQSDEPHLLELNFKVSKIICGENMTAIVSERGQLYTCGDGRHGKLALGQESFSNQFKPCRVPRFTQFIVEKVACGGCHMIVTAHKRLQNGDVDSEEDVSESSPILGQTLKTINPNDSVSARDRRRQTMPLHDTLNRTLPDLGTNHTLPTLNGHSTLPRLKNSENILQKDLLQKDLLQKDKIKKDKIKIEDNKEKKEIQHADIEDASEDTTEEKKTTTPRPLPRGSPVPKVPQPKDSESKEKEVASLRDENQESVSDESSDDEDEKVVKITQIPSKNQLEVANGDSSNEENKPPQSAPKPALRKKAEHSEHSEHSEEEEDSEREGKKVKKHTDKREETKKKKKKDTDVKEDEEDHTDEAKVKPKGKKGKKKSIKEKKNKKIENGDKEKSLEHEGEGGEKEGDMEKSDEKEDKDDKEKKDVPPPKKKSRFCTIL